MTVREGPHVEGVQLVERISVLSAVLDGNSAEEKCQA